jgi:hypothetical protein
MIFFSFYFLPRAKFFFFLKKKNNENEIIVLLDAGVNAVPAGNSFRHPQ